MASHSPKSVLTPTLVGKLSMLQSAQNVTSGEITGLLNEMATIPAGLVGRAGREIARAAGLGWWRLRVVPADLVFDRLQKLGGNPQRPALPPEWDLLNANPDYAWVFLFHPDGYVREAALHAIRTLPPSPFFSAALALRLNDWVPQVRLAAKGCLQRVASQIGASVAADLAFYLLPRRFTWTRWHDEVGILDQIFARDDILAALATELLARANGGVGICLRQALRFPNFDRHLLGLAAGAVQPSVRAIAYQSLISAKVSWPVGFEWIWVDKVYNRRRCVLTLQSRDVKRTIPLDEVLAAGVRDKSTFVRKIVADAMIAVRSEIVNEAPLIARLAADRNPAVRSRADFMLRHPVQRQVT
jgi:hypothetical protein